VSVVERPVVLAPLALRASGTLNAGRDVGTGGNSNSSFGTFFEGAVTAGRPSDATDLLVLQNAQAAGYGK
jgi:Alpha-L-arabinofuranosidase B, catalytic